MGIKNYSEKLSSKDFDRISSLKSRHQISSIGKFVQISSSGDDANIISKGSNAQISSSGDSALIISEGVSARISSSGDRATIDSQGLYAVVCCVGRFSHVRARIGSVITLTEWEYIENIGTFVPTYARTEQVDGKRIREDVYYCLTDGDFTEVSHE